MGYYDLAEKIKEEKEKPKDYGYVGTVQISATEYRELISSVEYARTCAKEEYEERSRLNSRIYDLNHFIDEKKAEMDSITESNNELKAFIKENNLEEQYKEWKFNKEMEFD